MNILGKSPINKFMYITGKLSMYAVWIVGILQLYVYNFRVIDVIVSILYISLFFAVLGILLSIISIFDLGKSVRFGIPLEKTILKTRGLYKFSRNPMYVGFFMLTISLMVFTINPLIIILGMYGIYVHHRITLSEEDYLKKEFGSEYLAYCKCVRRYI